MKHGATWIFYKQGNQIQKRPSKGVLRKRCSENMQQIYRRKPMPKCGFNKVAKQLYWNHTSAWDMFQHGCSPIDLLYIFRILFSKNTSVGLLLQFGG